MLLQGLTPGARAETTAPLHTRRIIRLGIWYLVSSDIRDLENLRGVGTCAYSILIEKQLCGVLDISAYREWIGLTSYTDDLPETLLCVFNF